MSVAKHVPTVTVELDKPRTISLTLDALRRLEEVTGQPLMGIELDPDKIVRNIDAWIWAGLDDADRTEISVSDISKMIHLGNLALLVSNVSSLIRASLPDVKTEPAAVTEPTAGISTSNNSGQLESMISV